ncbi:MAG: hypothetical protein LBG60_04925 [Bifidobacteriaceae bacterium]|jgi:hypothetical protein|nr:hypothetical protein [Bifidobacteriaceae bacterium]
MFGYRVVLEKTGGEPRAPRGMKGVFRKTQVVQADSLAEACDISMFPDADSWRVVSVEEVITPAVVSDTEIRRKLFAAIESDEASFEMLDPDSLDEQSEPLVWDREFDRCVREVAHALNMAGLTFDLDVTPDDDRPVYALVEVFDRARNMSVGSWHQVKDLTTDFNAAGWDGVVAIARRLLHIANELS